MITRMLAVIKSKLDVMPTKKKYNYYTAIVFVSSCILEITIFYLIKWFYRSKPEVDAYMLGLPFWLVVRNIATIDYSEKEKKDFRRLSITVLLAPALSIILFTVLFSKR